MIEIGKNHVSTSVAYELILKEGALKARREDILALLNARLSPDPESLKRIAARLEAIEDLGRLQDLLLKAAQAQDITAFEEQLKTDD